MNYITKLSMRRPVSVFIIILAIAVFGIQAIFNAPLELLPQMEMPMMMVITSYPGAGPEEVEEQVTSLVEASLAIVPGVDDITSISSEGQSMVQVMFEYGTNMDSAASDIQKNLNMYGAFMPETASEPMIIEMSLDMMPAITLAVMKTGDLDVFNYTNDTIVPEFEKLGGVASVSVSGGQEAYVSVELIEEEMVRYGLDTSTIAQQLQVANISMPAGNIEKGSSQLILRGESKYTSAQELATMPITTMTGAVITLRDVANVTETEKDATSISRFNGEETVSISITKRQSASTVDVCRDVVNTVNRLNAEGLGVEIFVISDTSTDITNAITTLAQTLLLAIVLSMLVLFLFFGEWRAAFIVGASMPISVMGTLYIMQQLGFTYNIISLGGLVIAVGMIVDNSIVVIESCFRSQNEHKDNKEAAIAGAKAVTASIVASTITTVVVFLPLAVMQGMTGELFAELGYTIIFALLASLISALTLVPLVFVRMKPKEKENLPITKMLERMNKPYERVLRFTFKHRVFVVFTSIVLLIGSFALLGVIKMELIPAIDQGTIAITTDTRAGLQLDKVDEIASGLEEVVAAHPDVERYSVTGSGSGITLNVYLKGDRVMSTDDVVEQWRVEFADTIDYTVSVASSNMADMISGGGTADVNIQSSNLDDLEIATKQVLEVMENHDLILSASSDLTDGNPQATIQVDPVKAASYGALPVQVISLVSEAMQGKMATTLQTGATSLDVYVEYPEDRYQTFSDLEGLYYNTVTGHQVPVMELVEVVYSNAPQSITKLNNQYLSTISGQPATGMASQANSEIVALVNQLDLPDSVSITGGAAMESMIEEFTAMVGAIAAAVFLVFMVMAMQFESVKFSLIVMMCIPFSLIGAFGFLAITGVSLSMVSLMGLLMLVGIVINNGILFIDTANHFRDTMSAEDALIAAGKLRMRPILMTTLTTILSMVPTALGIGSGSEIMQGMGVIIIGGLVASTLLTLILLPTFYIISSRGTDKRNTKKQNRAEKRKAKAELKGEVPTDTALDSGN